MNKNVYIIIIISGFFQDFLGQYAYTSQHTIHLPHIIVLSQSTYKWQFANSVALFLNLNKYILYIMSPPKHTCFM